MVGPPNASCVKSSCVRSSVCEVFLSQVFMPQAFRPRAVSAAARHVAHPRILRHLCNRNADGLGVKRPALRMATHHGTRVTMRKWRYANDDMQMTIRK